MAKAVEFVNADVITLTNGVVVSSDNVKLICFVLLCPEGVCNLNLKEKNNTKY